MLFSKILPLGLVVAITSASPIVNKPTRLTRRDLPQPSSYPLAEPCKHEWKYLNFDPENETDKARLEQLHGLMCSGEIRGLASNGKYAAENISPSYKRFFPVTDDEDDWSDVQESVTAVLKLLRPEWSGDPVGEITETFIVDNVDFGDPEFMGSPTCEDEGTLAYTTYDGDEDDPDTDGLEKTHFCETAYSSKSFDEVISDCAALDAYPSEKMDTFSRVVLHEMTHYSSVGDLVDGGEIKDVTMDDGERAYDPQRAHALIDASQGNFFNPAVTEINADNYAWMALDALVSRLCAGPDDGDDFFTENPPSL